MALGLNTASSGGNADIIAHVKFDARAGRISRPDRTMNGAGQYESNSTDITQTFRAVFDMENIEVGWFHFAAGVAPVSVLVPHGHPIPPKPTPDFKQGARVMLKLGNECGGDVREMTGSSGAFVRGFDALHDDYLAGVKANPGMLPVVKLASANPVKSGSGQHTSTNYEPHFEIVGWVPRPADLVFVPKAGGAAPAVASPSVAPQSYAPSTGSTQVGPPPAKAPQPALSDFG